MKPVMRRRRFALLSSLVLLGCAAADAQSLGVGKLTAAEAAGGRAPRRRQEPAGSICDWQ
jgi:hypothetical protein